MQYIRLANDAYILKLESKVYNFNKNSFNFHKIKKLISNKASKEEILPLLTTPKLPNGIFKAYVNSKNELYYINVTNKEKNIYMLKKDADVSTGADDNFLGVYASVKDIIADWPEYLF